jgi:signal transduction histidine kinase
MTDAYGQPVGDRHRQHRHHDHFACCRKLADQAKQLEEQNEALKENVRLREEVERIGRHDLKTPLNSILAAPRLLREGRNLTREELDLLNIVERRGLPHPQHGQPLARPLQDGAGDLHLHAASGGPDGCRVEGDGGRAGTRRKRRA